MTPNQTDNAGINDTNRSANRSTLSRTKKQEACFFMLTQRNIKKWLQKLGEKGYNNLLKELRQLDKKEGLIPVNKEDMSCEDQRKHLRALINRD